MTNWRPAIVSCKGMTGGDMHPGDTISLWRWKADGGRLGVTKDWVIAFWLSFHVQPWLTSLTNPGNSLSIASAYSVLENIDRLAILTGYERVLEVARDMIVRNEHCRDSLCLTYSTQWRSSTQSHSSTIGTPFH